MSDLMFNPEDHLNFHGKDWSILRAYLKQRMDDVVDRLCAHQSHDETTALRGQLRAYREILALEMAAPRAAEKE